MSLDVESVLGEKGRIAARLDRYEQRPEQLEMARAVEQAIATKTHLVVEAGTGVGKSFAYLVPAVLAAAAHSVGKGESDKNKFRIVISTHTIALQEQLIRKDIPFLNSVLPIEFSAVLVKGRSNYISLRRMKGALERSKTMFGDDEASRQLKQIGDWSKTTTDGSLSDLSFQPIGSVWDEVQSEHGNCLGKSCPTHASCFYYAARRRVWNADLLVVNHALFFSDLALRREGAKLLPDYNVVVFDEAHTVEAVAGDHLGLSVSSGQIDYLLNKLYNDRGNRGLLRSFHLEHLEEPVQRLRIQSDMFFDEVREWRQRAARSNGRFVDPPKIDNRVSVELKDLGSKLVEAGQKQKRDEDKVELNAAGERCFGQAQALDSWMKQEVDSAVYWLETAGRRQQNTKLVCAPIDVGPLLRDELFEQVPTAILTSATMAVGPQSFDFIRSRLGLTQGTDLKLGSPFDYKRQARLVVATNMPDPSEQAAAYETAVCDKIRKYVLQTEGRAFVLFTSYKMLNFCAERLQPWLLAQQISLYSQGDGTPRTLLLERFKKDVRAVLFGAESFWQGVDVPGDALQNVIITKLPFSVPDHPLLEARLDSIRQRGGNPFMEYQVPEAIIKLKQGFGRLIRSRTDTGQVVILDPRVKTKRYGKLFLESLPNCTLEFDEEV
ncbi:MAG: helicase [Planctomycetaceae bacterium]|nr:helicase [Planctomycetaceae bacterium]